MNTYIIYIYIINIFKFIFHIKPKVYGNIKCRNCLYYDDSSKHFNMTYIHYCTFKKIIKKDPVYEDSFIIKYIRCDKKNKYNNCLDFKQKIKKENVPLPPKGGTGTIKI